ncbi:MAG TPA: transcription antitermination factor NusB [Caulobacter sp.]|nr:transcription antitermination factor NusB [Caulobacter sp.]
MSGNRIQPRSVARLAAVQALYQMEVSGAGVDSVIREFSEHRFDRDVEGEQLAAADETFFAELAKGVVTNQAKVDQGIVKRLASGWRLERLDATARAVLRAGAFELMFRPDVPTEVVINEYVEIAKSFFEGPESGFINGALDAIARDARV